MNTFSQLTLRGCLLCLILLLLFNSVCQAEEDGMESIYRSLYSKIFSGLETIVTEQVEGFRNDFSDDGFSHPAMCSYLLWVTRQNRPAPSYDCEIPSLQLLQELVCRMEHSNTSVDSSSDIKASSFEFCWPVDSFISASRDLFDPFNSRVQMLPSYQQYSINALSAHTARKRVALEWVFLILGLNSTEENVKPIWLDHLQRAVRKVLRPYTEKRGADYSTEEQQQRALAIKLDSLIHGEFIQQHDDGFQPSFVDYGYPPGFAMAAQHAFIRPSGLFSHWSGMPAMVELLIIGRLIQRSLRS